MLTNLKLQVQCYGRIIGVCVIALLMKKLKEYYANTEIKVFAGKMYSLWESLPGNIQDEQPFFVLCYADDPLSWGDEKQTRELYEHMLNFYER